MLWLISVYLQLAGPLPLSVALTCFDNSQEGTNHTITLERATWGLTLLPQRKWSWFQNLAVAGSFCVKVYAFIINTILSILSIPYSLLHFKTPFSAVD